MYVVKGIYYICRYILEGEEIACKYFRHSNYLNNSKNLKDKKWSFKYFKNSPPPEDLSIPQSPRNESYFPYTAEEYDDKFDVSKKIKTANKKISKWKTKRAKNEIGANQFHYNVTVKYRIDDVRLYKAKDGTEYYEKYGESKLMKAKKSSKFYTSKKTFLKQDNATTSIDCESEMLNCLNGFQKGSKKNDKGEFESNFLNNSFKGNNIFNKEKQGIFENIIKEANKDKKTEMVSSIACNYYHSETQAASFEGHTEEIAKNIVGKIVKSGENHVKDGDTSCNLVVVSVIASGYSDQNSVCGNACKVSIASIGQNLEKYVCEEISKHAKSQDPKIKKSKENHWSIRLSSQFKTNFHVGSGITFKGDKKGAEVSYKPNDTPNEYENHNIYEYKPGSTK